MAPGVRFIVAHDIGKLGFHDQWQRRALGGHAQMMLRR
jgi:hypothetical protein